MCNLINEGVNYSGLQQPNNVEKFIEEYCFNGKKIFLFCANGKNVKLEDVQNILSGQTYDSEIMVAPGVLFFHVVHQSFREGLLLTVDVSDSNNRVYFCCRRNI